MRRLASLLLLPVLLLFSTQAPAVELLTNGDFSGGNAAFTSAYTLHGCTSAAHYEIVTEAHDCHASWHGTDHTSGAGWFMAVNGAGALGKPVWQVTVPVIPNHSYLFSAWISSLHTSSPAQLQFSINGIRVGAQGAPPTLSTWSPFVVIWNSDMATQATIIITDSNTAAGGNDFGLDDISFAGDAATPTRAVTWGRLKIIYR